MVSRTDARVMRVAGLSLAIAIALSGARLASADSAADPSPVPAPVGAGSATAPAARAEPPEPPADTTGVPQRDLLDLFASMMGRKPLPTELAITPKPGLSITLLPSVGYNPSYGAFIGVSAAMGGWLGDPANTTPSAGSAGVSYSTTGQISVQLKTDFYTPGNGWALKGDWRYLDTHQDTYGLGPATVATDKVGMDFLLYRFYQTVYRNVPGTAYFVGFGYHFNRWDEIHETDVPPGTVTDYQVYSHGGLARATSSGLSCNVLYDTRDNPINARRGTFWNASVRSFVKGLGSDHDWQGVWSDFRAYPRLPKSSRNTLAIWNYAWFTFGEAPYLDLPATGWDTYGRGARGWLQGRIRGTNQIYTEAEYRAALRADGLLGAVAFVNLMATTLPGAGHFGPLDPAYGAGLRISFNKRTATNLGVDAAWDRFGAFHMFFGMQEVF